MYLVVFEGIGGEHSNTPGMRTIIDYGVKENFLKHQAETTNTDKVVAEGISEEEADRLVEEVGFKPYFDQAYNEANYCDNFDWPLYQMHLRNIQHLMVYRRSKKK